MNLVKCCDTLFTCFLFRKYKILAKKPVTHQGPWNFLDDFELFLSILWFPPGGRVKTEKKMKKGAENKGGW